MWETVGGEAIMAATQALSPGTSSAIFFVWVRSSYRRGNQEMSPRRSVMPSFSRAFARCSPMPLMVRTSVFRSAIMFPLSHKMRLL